MRARRRSAAAATAIAATVAAIATAGCHRPAGPERVLDEYFAHLRAGRIAAAYALTTPAYRARHTEAAFALAAAQQPLLARGERRGAERALSIELGDRDPVRVASSGGRLTLVADPFERYANDTPEAALRAFARAVELGRRERVVPLVAPLLREALGPSGPLPPAIVERAQQIARRLAAPLGPIITDGASARWLTGDAQAISLERGPAGWWITAL